MKIRLVDTELAIPRYRQVRLPTVAAELAPYAEVEINDENVEPLDRSPVDLVGFTAQVYNAERAALLSRDFRARGVKTILGGPHATAMPAWALEHFDAVVAGEVEGLGERLVSDLEHGRLGGIYRNERPPDLATMRLPRRDLQRSDRYYAFNFPIELSRGCPHACTFCFGRDQFPTFRLRPLEHVAADLARREHGMVEVVDLHCAANRKHLIAACRLFEEAGVPGWFGECTLPSLDDEDLLAALERSNCKMMFVGLESIEPRALDSVAKGWNPIARSREIIARVQDHGIFVHAGLIWGLDGASRETYDATLGFCEEVGLYLASTNLLTCYPGTRAHEQARAAGRLRTEDLRAFDALHVVVEPEGATAEDVYAGGRRFVSRFYGLGSIFRRSFQTPNYRLSQLVDYWAFNLLYRAYYRRWSALLGRTDRDEGKRPYARGLEPPLYALLDLSWRCFEAWYRLWDRAPRPASALLALLAAAAVALGAALGLAWVRVVAEASPVLWPQPWQAALAFLPASWLAAWLAHRAARATRRRALALAAIPLALAPPLACALAVPSAEPAWRFALVLATVVLGLKAWSLSTTGAPERKGLLRSLSFLLLYPTLDFERAFEPAPTKRPLAVHYPLAARGLVELGLGALAFAATGWAIARGLNEGWARPPLALARLLVATLCLAGAFDVLASWWRMAGYRIPRGVERPASLGPAELWRRWNVPFHDWLVRHVHVPLGGRARPLLAVLGTFVASGLLAELTLDVAAGAVAGTVLPFFVANGLVAAVDRRLERVSARGRAARLVSFVVGVAVFLATAPWLFSVTDRVLR